MTPSAQAPARAELVERLQRMRAAARTPEEVVAVEAYEAELRISGIDIGGELADIQLTNHVGNQIPNARMLQIRGILRHFNWGTERVKLVMALADIDVHGDVDAGAQVGTFFDYREQGWIVARVVRA